MVRPGYAALGSPFSVNIADDLVSARPHEPIDMNQEFCFQCFPLVADIQVYTDDNPFVVFFTDYPSRDVRPRFNNGFLRHAEYWPSSDTHTTLSLFLVPLPLLGFWCCLESVAHLYHSPPSLSCYLLSVEAEGCKPGWLPRQTRALRAAVCG